MPYKGNGCCLQGGLELEAALGLNQGHYGVRLSGQDVERGTFNHRHAVLYHQSTGERCVRRIRRTRAHGHYASDVIFGQAAITGRAGVRGKGEQKKIGVFLTF